MKRAEIEPQLHQIIREALGQPDLTLHPATTARDVAGWDSVRQVVIILSVEEHFGITLRAREIDRLRNVSDFEALVAAKLGAA